MTQSYLLTGTDKKAKSIFLEKLQKSENIDSLDITIFEQDKPLGIEDVRNLQKNLFLKPLKGRYKILFIDVPSITTEAQNALLKTLEEPPHHTRIIISLLSMDAVLETILSRCKQLAFEKKLPLSGNAIDFSKLTMGGKLKLAQDEGKSREDALKFLQDSIFCLRETLLVKIQGNQSIENSLRQIMLLQKGYTTIKTTNIAPRFSLENVFLSWKSSS